MEGASGTGGGWLLAIDTSTEIAGLALDDGDRRFELAWHAGRDQTVTVLAEIDHLLGLAGIEQADLAAIAIATGPGMFNGLRVGTGVAKGLVLGLDVALIGISTLDATVEAFRGFGLPVVGVVAAGRGRLVWRRYEPVGTGFESVAVPVNGTPAELADVLRERPGSVIVAGELMAMQREQIAAIEGVFLPASIGAGRRAAGVAALGRRRLARGEVDDAAALGPAYVHAGAAASPDN